MVGVVGTGWNIGSVGVEWLVWTGWDIRTVGVEWLVRD